MEEQSDYERVFRPPDLESFYQGNFDVLLKIWRQGNEFETLSLGIVPGFYTIQDIKRLLYSRKRSPEYIPRFVFIGIPVGNPNVEPSKSTRYQAADFSWIRDNAEPPNLQSPMATLSMPDPRFADATGQWGTYKENRREGVTLEEAPIVRSEEGNIIFHIFTLSRLLSAFQRPRPIALGDWNTRFAMFFPRVPPSGAKSSPTEDDEKDMRDIQTYLMRKQQRVDMLEALLGTTATPEVTIKGVQRLRFTLKPAADFNSTEMLFYSLPVSHRVPFLRLLTPTGEPINKLFTKDSFYPPRPDIEDPNFLRQWAQQEAPEPTEDFMFSKILIREIRTSQKPLYATHRTFQDGSSDIVVLPLKQERILDISTDLGTLYEQLEEAITGENLTMASAKLGDMTAVFQIELDAEDVKIDRKELERRLPCFSPFFQLTPVYSTEVPQLMVRYKAVSNFAVDNILEKKSNINTYIQILAERDRVKGDAQAPPTWIPKIAEEFQISITEATNYLRDWALKKSEFVLVTQDDILEGNHQGIDIAIFENHPSYSFHVYGVNHPNHLMRIIMLMRLLLGVPSDQLVCSTKAAQSFSEAEQSLGDHDVAPAGSAAAAGGSMYNAGEMGMNVDTGQVDFGVMDYGEAGGAEQNTAAAATAEEAAPEEEEAAPTITEEELKGKTSRDAPKVDNYILNLLLKSDPELFDYKRGPEDEPYSRKCQATMDAQPIVMSKQQFEKNYKLYQEDCIVFPLRGEAQPPIIDKTEEKFTFLRYGSGPDKDLYYTCPPIFCVRDFLIIRRSEFKSSMGRDGKRKDPYTCPFCRGTVITNKKVAVINATVIVRAAKNRAPLKYDGRDKTLQYIGFQKDDSHPKGFRFPCCFLKPPTETVKGRKSYSLTADNPAFADQTKWLRKGLLGRLDINTVVEDADAEADAEQAEGDTDEEIEKDYAPSAAAAEEDEEDGFQLQTKPREFRITLQDLPNEYIQEPNKSLNHGKIALLNKTLSSYFEQDSKAMVKVISSKQTLTPNAQGLLRVGVGNTPRNRPDSLFACLAPLLGVTVISQVKDIILERITPRVFVHLNYGNLVNEYFNPNDPEPEGDIMATFASTHLHVKNDAANKMAISRFFRSYKRFEYEVRSTTSRKQLRVFSDILQQPNLLYSPGTNRCLVLVVLETDVLNAESAVRVLCPPYGISPYARDNADFAFIVRFVGDGVIPYYEPLIYTENFPAIATRGPIHRHNFIFQRAAIGTWSKTVKPRIVEFLNKCEGPGRQLYASKAGIDPYAMISISQLTTFLGMGLKALRGSPLSPFGILRDSHNHIAGLLYPTKNSRFVLVPCVDDGYIYPGIPNIEIDFEGFSPATVDEIESFYKMYVTNKFNALYPGYVPKAQIITKYDTQVVAVELANGLMIPAQPAKKPTTLPERRLEAQIEWRMNKLIINNEAPATSEPAAAAAGDSLTMEHVNKLYEHFRVSFANWLMGTTAAKVKESITAILKNPAYDLTSKRKNLDIFLRSTIEKWLDPDEEYEVIPFDYLRRDCITLDVDKCSGVCRWREQGDEPKCRIHVPETSGQKNFNTVELFCQRLYDELIRIPFKRKELLNNHVSKLNPPTEAIYDATLHQWILPDNSADWITLKRMEWTSEKFDEPRYFEEMSSEPDSAKVSEFLSRLGPEVIAFLGAGSEKLFQWQPPASDTAVREPYIVFAPMLGFGFSDPDMGLPRDAFVMSQEVATKAARKAGKMLIFANFSKNSFIVGRPAQAKSYILFLEQEGKIPSLIVSSARSAGMAFEDLPTTVRDVIGKSAPKQTIKLRPAAATT
jgi:hypothetical protein